MRSNRTTLHHHHHAGPGHQFAVQDVPHPNTIHGVALLEDATEVEVIGEIGMGGWITVIDSEGNRSEVEVHMPLIPWHRPDVSDHSSSGLNP